MPSPNVISFSLIDSMKGAVDYATKRASFDLIMARVSFVLLDDSDKNKFTSLGGWKAIGTIECRPFVNFNNPEEAPIIARPISSNINRYPLVNEIVILKVLVSKEAQNSFDNYKPEIYYTDIISLFNATEENAAPDSSYLKLNPNEKYVTGKYAPSGQIKRLIKAPGDITIEGRRGNSIRFGSNMSGFRTPWTAKDINPILVISNNPVKPSGSAARFESINDDGSTLMMMSGHNVNFQPASSNFESYNTLVTIPEKNNIVVTDPEPKSKPEESLKQEDEKPIPKETPKPDPIPVAVAVPPSSQTLVEEDKEEMPEREDLLKIDIDIEDVKVSIGSSGAPYVDPEQLNSTVKKKVQESGGSLPSNIPQKKYVSRAQNMNDRITANLKKYGNNGAFLTKLTNICVKYSILSTDMLRIMAFESGGDFQRGKLSNQQTGKAQAVGIIQFTDAKKNSVFQNIRKQPQFSSLKVLEDIADVPIIKVKGQSSKYDFDQLDLVDFYLSTNSSRLKPSGDSVVDRYAVYGIIFYPYIVNGGTISKPDNFVLGSEKSPEFAFKVGTWNEGINAGFPITVKAFKDFVDSLFGNSEQKK